MSQLQFIDQQRLHYSVQLLCQVLNIVPSRYYAWRKGMTAGAVASVKSAWETALVEVFNAHQRRYGARRLQAKSSCRNSDIM